MKIRPFTKKPSQIIRHLISQMISLNATKYAPDLISPKGYRRIYHAHIRKCAGTSLNTCIIDAISGRKGEYAKLARQNSNQITYNERPVVGWNKTLLKKEAFFFGFSHIPFFEFNFSDDTFVFTFLRDPVARIISHYRMLKDMEMSDNQHPSFIAEKKWACGDFGFFIRNVPKEHLQNQLYMYSRSFDVEEALRNISRVNYVGHVNSISSHFIPELHQEFGLPLDYVPLRASSFQLDITRSQRLELNDILSAEIAFYRAVCMKRNIIL